MLREVVNALAACVVTFALCSVAYPAAVWGVAWVAFPKQAAGSLIERGGKVIGSELIAQPFASDIYFFPRPSAVDYKAGATGGSNLGTKNPDLRKKVAERAEALNATDKNPVPADMVTASGGGLDPDISPAAAYYQAPRVAQARKVPLEQVRSLIDRHIDRSGAIIGAPARVNVLKLNLALDAEIPAPPKTAADAPTPEPAETKPANEDVAVIRAGLKSLSEQLERLGKQVDSIPPASKAEGELKALAARG
jgi:potassium-transporting ATPase KdpC subunit